nr:transposase (putative), gypsy type [Tanacetum cinerariifolium]
SSLRSDVAPLDPFITAWHMTTHSILNDAESCRDMMINLATPTVRDQQSHLSDYQALQRAWFELGRGTLAKVDLL